MKTSASMCAAALCAALSLGSPARADDLTIPLPDGVKVQRLKASYSCPGIGAFTAEYVIAGDISLALLPVEGKPLVFANVLAGSGVRYMAGPYVWWTKGDTAALYDIRKGEKAEPVQCQEKQ